MFGLVVIVLSVLLAIFAYFISPDPSPYANRIILEVARQKPGYRQMFLKIKKKETWRTLVFLNDSYRVEKIDITMFQ